MFKYSLKMADVNFSVSFSFTHQPHQPRQQLRSDKFATLPTLMPALPRLFRRQRLLIVGCGDVGMRILRHLQQRPRPPRIFALTRQPEQQAELRAGGAVPVLGDLDRPTSLYRLRGLAHQVIHLAPPPAHGTNDPRTRHLLSHLTRRCILTYVSTTGVYGDCNGALIDETQPKQPRSERGKRRVAAEKLLRRWGKTTGHCVSILRAPGIYAEDRLPLERIRQGLPILQHTEDVYTNHIHADDLARLCYLGLIRGRANRSYNACDNQAVKMGDWIEAVARRFNLPPPPRLARAEVQQQVSAMQWTFMQESRQISNQRIREEWGVILRFPSALDFLDGLS